MRRDHRCTAQRMHIIPDPPALLGPLQIEEDPLLAPPEMVRFDLGEEGEGRETLERRWGINQSSKADERCGG
jgi:hypothetical protein